MDCNIFFSVEALKRFLEIVHDVLLCSFYIYWSRKAECFVSFTPYILIVLVFMLLLFSSWFRLSFPSLFILFLSSSLSLCHTFCMQCHVLVPWLSHSLPPFSIFLAFSWHLSVLFSPSHPPPPSCLPLLAENQLITELHQITEPATWTGCVVIVLRRKWTRAGNDNGLTVMVAMVIRNWLKQG